MKIEEQSKEIDPKSAPSVCHNRALHMWQVDQSKERKHGSNKA